MELVHPQMGLIVRRPQHLTSSARSSTRDTKYELIEAAEGRHGGFRADGAICEAV
ncbi:MAG: hypothetical protein ACLS6G_08255 [Christensenellales bacterium]